jgi:hypothetical protein
MKTKIVKNYLDRIVSAMFCLLMLVYSQYGYAVTVNVPIELQCSRNPLLSSWVTIPGQPGTQYALTTMGIKESIREEEGVLEVIKISNVGRTHYGLHVFVEARCMPSNKGNDLSLTGSLLVCADGEGIKVRMFEPNSSDPDKYRYAGMLVVNKSEEETKQIIIDQTNVVYDKKVGQQLRTETMLVAPKGNVGYTVTGVSL